jgi:translation initiation factor IF-1
MQDTHKPPAGAGNPPSQDESAPSARAAGQNQMSKSGKPLVEGEVIDMLPNAQFKVVLADGVEIRAYLSGRMRQNRIRIILGDKVRIEREPIGDIHKIVRRL